MKYLLLFFGLVCSVFTAAAERPVLLPLPQQLEWNKERFSLHRVIEVSDTAYRYEVEELISPYGGLTGRASSVVQITKVKEIPGAKVNQEEAYRLVVRKNRITIEAVTDRGVFWALQTLRQLTVEDGKQGWVQGCDIVDWPAFRIRGFMHDVGRGYIPMEELKKEIAILSGFKINVFHWHLTEDLGWRLESKLFPMLNDSANFGRMPGKYYTIAEARELVQFCRKHRVLLIPEVDMPGHSAAFRKTFRHDMQDKEGMAILKLLMDEICDEIFPGIPYIHIGTDEVQFKNKAFVPEMVAYVRNKGKKVISWNPGWNYKAGEIDMLQMWSSRGKPHPGIPVIDSRLHYINHYDAFADLVGLYNSNIAGVAQGSDDYAGIILGVWNDRAVESDREILLQNGFYPAMLACAERSWRGGGDKYWYEQGVMMDKPGSKGYADFADFENRMLWHKEYTLKGLPFAYVRQSHVKWRITDAFPNDGVLLKSFPPETGLDTSYVYAGKNYGSREAVGAGIYLRHVWGTLIPAFYKEPRPNHTAYAYTWVYSPVSQQVGFWFSTQNYGRSERDIPPLQGKWDYRESRVWVNDNEITPPVWSNTHRKPDNEISLGNENFMSRSPLLLILNKGWNKVLVKLPAGEFTSPEVRLVKWMFTAVFVTPGGEGEPDGLVYSPERKR